MSEKQWTIAGVVAAVVFGAPSWWVMFIEHPETAGMMVTTLRVISPVVMFAIGAFTGYKYCSWKSSERRATELAAKDAEIAELRRRPTPEEIEAAQSAQSALDEYDRARREARSAFRSLSARDMEFIIGLYESGVRTVGDPDPIIAVLGQRGIVRKALDSPLVIDLDPKWRARIDAFRDVFDDVYSGKKGCIDR